jgi:hypothetical protein
VEILHTLNILVLWHSGKRQAGHMKYMRNICPKAVTFGWYCPFANDSSNLDALEERIRGSRPKEPFFLPRFAHSKKDLQRSPLLSAMDASQLRDFQVKTKAFVGELREQLQIERQQKEAALARVKELESGELFIAVVLANSSLWCLLTHRCGTC